MQKITFNDYNSPYLSAETLNQLQTNIENAINDKGNYTNLSNKPKLNSIELNGNKTLDDLSIQAKLVSGTNIKTINNQSILGSGNITVQSGSGGTSDYTQLSNKPKINSVELSGNKTLSDLGINNFSGNYNDLSNKPTIYQVYVQSTQPTTGKKGDIWFKI